ncbi:1,4-dihydroxy-2-naphthoate polyprenyltransferase [Enterococcus timonensis]|uniref:1,4-dihydroxy-2-naphthoate polyprenyltransferase n=1 Tax=Enterococcus timonensis TaxID=1852364 RepID=UPI0008D9441C|nr:1,4-dihydroxy-2-naphthoate polyprenyltransferase [Enterococcus timonensis]
MTVKSFLKLVEIQTKMASVFPFFMALFFSWSYFETVNWGYMALFFAAMLLFDMATTTINNYQDFMKAKDEHYKYEENILGTAQIQPSLVRKIILGMTAAAFLIGLFLVWQTGWLLLFMGAACCFIGIFYTSGPIPLSRMPLGEVFSGVTMGVGIPAMVIYLNTFQDKIFFLDLSNNQFALTGTISGAVAIVWASLPLVFTIANIMLANNLRDLDTDIVNHRFTLVFYIGRKNGTTLFEMMQLACFAVLLIGFFFGVYQWPILLVFLTLPKVWSTLKKHRKEVPAPISFKRSMENFILFNGAYVLALVLTVVLQQF